MKTLENVKINGEDINFIVGDMEYVLKNIYIHEKYNDITPVECSFWSEGIIKNK